MNRMTKEVIDAAEEYVRERYNIKGNVPSELVYKVATLDALIQITICLSEIDTNILGFRS